MSGRPGIGQKRFSHDRFQMIPESEMTKPHDATIEIPLTAVSSRGQTGARKPDSSSPLGSSYVPPTSTTDVSGQRQDTGEKSGISPGRRLKKTENDGKAGKAPEDGTLTQMGKFYNRILNYSVITRYFIYVLPLAFAIAIPIIVGATGAQKANIGGVRIVWFFSWVEVVWLSLWVAKIFAHYVPLLFQFLCGIVSSGTRKYALILRALETPISLVGWAAASLATFIPIMTKNPDQQANNDTATKGWQDVVKNILFAALISTLILTAEKVLVQLISISYHRKQFDSKIQESKRHIYLVGMLYDASRKMFPVYCNEFEHEDMVINDSIIPVGKKGRTQTGSASPMRLMQNVGRVGDKISAAVGQVAHDLTGKKVFDSNSSHSTVILALERRDSTEALARRLWMSFVLQGRDALYIDDLYDVFGAGQQAEAEECFAALDKDDNGDISLDEMILMVTEFGRARESISKSMHDVDQAIHVLDNLLCTVVFVLVVLVFIAFLNEGFGTTLAAGATALLSMSFVFAVTAQEVLGSCIFLFVKHPYDVGDRVDIKDNRFIVEHISLLFTGFRSVDTHKVVQVPNIVLNTQWIENITRSKAMREKLNLTVDFTTSFGDIQLLKQEMQSFVRDKENSRDFQPDVDVEVAGVGEMSKLELVVEIRHKGNWHNETVRAARRSKFLCALVIAVRKIPIYGPGGGDALLGDVSKPSYSVTISPEQAQVNRDEYDSDKEKSRMIPTDKMESLASVHAPISETKPATTGSEPYTKLDVSGLQFRGGSTAAAPSSEATFAESLNSRPAAMDKSRVTESDIMRTEDNTKPLRQASTGQRKLGDTSSDVPPQVYVSPNTPISEEMPMSAQMQMQAQYQPPDPSSNTRPPVEYHEYTTPFHTATPASGRESPYQSNNPYARSSPGPSSPPPGMQQQQHGSPSLQSPPSRTGTPTGGVQAPPSRRPVPTGNAFAQQQNQQPPR